MTASNILKVVEIGWEYVSQVIRRTLSNIAGNSKKAVWSGDYFLKILEFFSLAVTSLSENSVRTVEPVFSLSTVIKSTKVNSKSLHNKILKREKFLTNFLKWVKD